MSGLRRLSWLGIAGLRCFEKGRGCVSAGGRVQGGGTEAKDTKTYLHPSSRPTAGQPGPEPGRPSRPGPAKPSGPGPGAAGQAASPGPGMQPAGQPVSHPASNPGSQPASRPAARPVGDRPPESRRAQTGSMRAQKKSTRAQKKSIRAKKKNIGPEKKTQGPF